MSVHTSTETETVARVLGEATRRHFGGPATIEALSRQSGGASRQTWSFDAVVNGERHALILRRDPPAQGKTERERAIAVDRATEFRVLRAAHAAGVLAPEPLFELTPQDGLGEAYVMRRIGGIAIARKLLRDAPYELARGKIAGQLGEILA
ncbi:MAG: phosphotransferase, partial [Reyranella sp.]|nr:phosphotransferase [Reyranella sp.]